jgi:hypothetical protein
METIARKDARPGAVDVLPAEEERLPQRLVGGVVVRPREQLADLLRGRWR